MGMMLNLVMLFVGFVLLIKGSDVFVDGASSIAKKLGVPSLIVGLTIVAMGTSAPELSVSLTSSLAGMNDMSIANVVGSNIFNILMVLGISALVGKIKTEEFSDMYTMFGSMMILLITTMDGKISKFDGFGMLILFVLYILSLVISSLKSMKNKNTDDDGDKQHSLVKSLIFIVLGLVAVVFGGDFVVDSASSIAAQLGMSENLIGLTIVALGTSLPELVTSVTATRKGDMGIAIGNVLGSNIFNILLILGTASSICPLAVSTITLIDVITMCGITILLILSMAKKHELNKYKGLLFILIYASYIIYTIVR